MFKFLLVAALVAVLLFFIVRRLGLLSNSARPMVHLPPSDWVEIGLNHLTLKNVVKKTMITVFSGFALLILVLLVAAKFRIALIMLPISFYLIGQYFILMNQIKTSRRQKILFNQSTKEVKVDAGSSGTFSFNLRTDDIRVEEVKSVQKNNSILFGYYCIFVSNNKLVIPFIIEQNFNTKPFFNTLNELPRVVERRMFPIA